MVQEKPALLPAVVGMTVTTNHAWDVKFTRPVQEVGFMTTDHVLHGEPTGMTTSNAVNGSPTHAVKLVS